MSKTIKAPNAVDSYKVASIVAWMREIGADTLTVTAVEVAPDTYIAIEASHRLAAAMELGLEIEIETAPKWITLADYDLDLGDVPARMLGSDVAAILAASNGDTYEF